MKSRYTKEEVVDRGRTLYAERIRPEVTPGNHGRFVVINVETGEFELADGEDGVLLASDRLHILQPGAPLYVKRIGYPAATFIGMVPRPDKSQ